MTTEFLTIKFAKFPTVIVMEFHKKKKKKTVFSDNFPSNFPLPNLLQDANFNKILLSASLTIQPVSDYYSKTLSNSCCRRRRAAVRRPVQQAPTTLESLQLRSLSAGNSLINLVRRRLVN